MQTTLWILGRSHSFQVQPKRSRQLSTLFPIPLLWVHPLHLWKLLNIKTEHGTKAPSMLFVGFVGNPLQHLLQTHRWVLKIYPEGCWGSSPGSLFFWMTRVVCLCFCSCREEHDFDVRFKSMHQCSKDSPIELCHFMHQWWWWLFCRKNIMSFFLTIKN